MEPTGLPTRVANKDLVAQRRNHLIRSATHLLLDKGFHKTSVREIAEAAGMSMGALYLYINKKEDVLFLIAESWMAELTDGLISIPRTEDPVRDLERAVDYFFDASNRIEGIIMLLYRESANIPKDQRDQIKQSEIKTRAYISDIIRDGVSTGDFECEYVQLMAHNVIQIAHMWSLKSWALQPELTFDTYRAHQKDVIFRALQPR